jgi:hypothetical protein
MDHDPLQRGRRASYAARGNRLEAQVVGPSGPGESWERLGEVEWRAQQILCALDELGLHQPAAYVSMALDLMRQARLDLLPTG